MCLVVVLFFHAMLFASVSVTVAVLKIGICGAMPVFPCVVARFAALIRVIPVTAAKRPITFVERCP